MSAPPHPPSPLRLAQEQVQGGGGAAPEPRAHDGHLAQVGPLAASAKEET